MEITKKELERIVKVVNAHYGVDTKVEWFDGRVAIIKNYMSDCPSWVGDIALVIGGEECFKTILYRNRSTGHNVVSEGDWYVHQTINEGEYEEFSDE
jgi:hypothetical protein